MRIRQVNISDASSIAAISVEVWIGTYLKRGVTEFFADYALNTFTKTRTEALIVDPDQHIFVSENDSGINGFIRLSSHQPAPVAGCSQTEIATLYVQPHHHGRGIGKRLLDTALTHCRDAKVQSVWLATNAENTPAIAFYRKYGFKHMGDTYFCIADQAYLNNIYRLSIA